MIPGGGGGCHSMECLYASQGAMVGVKSVSPTSLGGRASPGATVCLGLFTSLPTSFSPGTFIC